jgi:hypothetical protein
MSQQYILIRLEKTMSRRLANAIRAVGGQISRRPLPGIFASTHYEVRGALPAIRAVEQILRRRPNTDAELKRA